MKTQEQHDQEVIMKAVAIQEMVQNSPGWKYLVEAVVGVLEREKEGLANQKLDDSYYKKIGFLQFMNYCKEIPNVIKDKKIRNYLLTQGRVLGAKSFLNAPKFFVEGIMKNNEIVRKFYEENNAGSENKRKAEFHQEHLK